MKESISSIIEIENYSINQDRKFFSATHEEMEKGLTTDIYFVRAQEILRYLRLENTIVKDVPRIILIDIFKDEAEESIRVACALGKDLLGVRLDTPSERGGVTPDLVKEVRARLNQAGFPMVKIFVSAVSPQKK
jgi:nicotinic acid phosphoribosyltransferase